LTSFVDIETRSKFTEKETIYRKGGSFAEVDIESDVT